MSMQLDWDVVRYVLDDPALDRPAFEQRMLHDESLAWAVADAVEAVEQLRIASRFLDKQRLLLELANDRRAIAGSVVTPVATERTGLANAADDSHGSGTGWHWSSLAALAAGLLLLIASSSASLTRWANQHRDSTTDSLAMRTSVVSTQALADRWLALETTSDGDVPAIELFGEDQDSRWSLSEGSQASAEPAADAVGDDQDWLMEAASQFYAEGAAS